MKTEKIFYDFCEINTPLETVMNGYLDCATEWEFELFSKKQDAIDAMEFYNENDPDHRTFKLIKVKVNVEEESE